MGTLDLRDLIASEEEWLCERVLTHALAHGYTADSSTLELAWRSAICGLSEPMKLMLDKGFQPPEIFRDPDPGVSPLIAFSARQAQTHRARGIPLADFLGLMKYYRRAYLDLIARHYPPGDEADRHTEFVNAFFESAEIGICAGWEDRDETADLREAAETNRRLVNEKNRYLTIFETLDEPVLLIDASGKISNFNLAASHLFDEKAVAGRGYYGKDALSGLSDQIAGLVPPAGDTTEFEHVLKTRRGPRAFRIKMQRMLDVSEKFTDTVIIMTDITDFRRAQRASEAADRAKTAFLATVSHEIRTPINGILGIGELLGDAPLTEKQRSYVDALMSSGELLLDMVNDVLDYSKLEAGEIELQAADFSPREMVERVVRLSVGEAARKGLRLDLDVAGSCPPSARADVAKIQRILVNLIGNAVKFTSRGSVSVSVGASEGRLSFAVRDTGPGIPAGDRSRVFQAFVQLSAPDAPQIAGTGLGLPVCVRLAELLGAELTLECPQSGGTLFRLDCPVGKAAAQIPEAAQPVAEIAPLDVLLVEDNAVNTMVIRGFLESDGHRVDCVSDGGRTLERLRARRHDIVLMDVRLQGANGFEIIGRIRACDEASIGAIPILVLTADRSEALDRQFASSGADALESKPLGREDLRAAIARAFNGRTRPRRAAPSASPLAEVPVLDASVIAGHLSAIGADRTDRIVTAFLETARRHGPALRAAADAGDGSAISDIAHGLRSAGHMIGLHRLSEAAERVEARIASGCPPSCLVEAAEDLCLRLEEGSAALLELTGAK